MGTKRHVIIELAQTATMAIGVGGGVQATSQAKLEPVDGLTLDHQFNVAFSRLDLTAVATANVTEMPTVLVRGQIDEELLEKGSNSIGRQVLGVYADPVIEAFPRTCIGSPALGDWAAVRKSLGLESMHSKGQTGENVLVAIVDTGINLGHLRARGLSPRLDSGLSWAPESHGSAPGEAPIGHGTMCAFDALIGAPGCTLLDIAVLRPVGFQTLLSDAVRAYAHLLGIARKLSQRSNGLIISNSWGMFHPTWDIAVGQPGNYSDDPNHPFNRIIGTLESNGADILFAAGNCGHECPDSRCKGITDAGITGANSHAKALCIAGVDINKQRVGYSSTGPGRLDAQKPDLAAFTHFDGSRIEGMSPDSGTSAATPVAAGAIAAVRSKFPHNSASPEAMRKFLRNSAESRGSKFNLEYGWGVLNVMKAADLNSLPS